jgi:hypothetical protein
MFLAGNGSQRALDNLTHDTQYDAQEANKKLHIISPVMSSIDADMFRQIALR